MGQWIQIIERYGTELHSIFIPHLAQIHYNQKYLYLEAVLVGHPTFTSRHQSGNFCCLRNIPGGSQGKCYESLAMFLQHSFFQA